MNATSAVPRPERWRRVIDARYGTALVQRLSAEIRARGLALTYRDFPGTKGDLDGAQILVEPGLPIDEEVFLLCHLFGHTVQWHVEPGALDAARIGVGTFRAEDEARVTEYETRASRYGLTLLQAGGARLLRRWLSEFVAADVAYVLANYRGAHPASHNEFWSARVLLLDPLPIPDFTPRVLSSRVKGRVL